MKKILILSVLFGLMLLAGLSAGASEQPFEWFWNLADNRLEIVLSAPKDAYVYENMTEVRLEHGGKTLRAEKTPLPVEKEDPLMGRTRVYAGRNVWAFSLKTEDLPFLLSVAWQGCGAGEKGSAPVCYLPTDLKKEFQTLADSSGILYGNQAEKPARKTDTACSGPEFRIERTASSPVISSAFVPVITRIPAFNRCFFT